MIQRFPELELSLGPPKHFNKIRLNVKLPTKTPLLQKLYLTDLKRVNVSKKAGPLHKKRQLFFITAMHITKPVSLGPF